MIDLSPYITKEADLFLIDATEVDSMCDDWQRLEEGDMVRWNWNGKRYMGKAMHFGSTAGRIFNLVVL